MPLRRFLGGVSNPAEHRSSLLPLKSALKLSSELRRPRRGGVARFSPRLGMAWIQGRHRDTKG